MLPLFSSTLSTKVTHRLFLRLLVLFWLLHGTRVYSPLEKRAVECTMGNETWLRDWKSVHLPRLRQIVTSNKRIYERGGINRDHRHVPGCIHRLLGNNSTGSGATDRSPRGSVVTVRIFRYREFSRIDTANFCIVAAVNCEENILYMLLRRLCRTDTGLISWRRSTLCNNHALIDECIF